LSGKTVTLPAASVTAHATTPLLDSPVITGTLSVIDEGTVTHTISNWSDELSYTITPTNCTVGAINGSGEFVRRVGYCIDKNGSVNNPLDFLLLFEPSDTFVEIA